MERYKELREKLSSEVDHGIQNHQLSSYANRLNKIDQDNFEDMIQDTDPNYEPTRAKEVDLKKYETFENEYLKDFLDEVKSYNIEKGHRRVDDTEQNILEEIQAQGLEPTPFDTTNEPIGFDDLVKIEEDAIDFDAAIQEASLEQDLLNEINEVNESEIMDTDALINSLQSENFAKDEVETETVKTETPQEKENIFKTLEQDFVEPTEETPSETDYDPFWNDYLQKMNELEDESNHIYTGPKDDLNFPAKRTKAEPAEIEERDITQEFLALTREIEKENLQSIDLAATAEVDQDEIIDVEHEEPVQKATEDNTVIGDFDRKELRKSRFVNGILTIALAGIILGVAILIKHFVLK